MFEQVVARLESLGYEVTEDDTLALNFAIQKADNYVKHFCNISEIPECLEHVVVDISSGEFLMAKNSCGNLTSIQIEQTVKQIQDGDSLVEYASSVDKNTVFNDYLDRMINGYNNELIAHRKLRW